MGRKEMLQNGVQQVLRRRMVPTNIRSGKESYG